MPARAPASPTLADTGTPSSGASSGSLEDPAVLTPQRVALKSVRYIAAGAAHTVAVTAEATYSWGAGKEALQGGLRKANSGSRRGLSGGVPSRGARLPGLMMPPARC
jgi:hypothetical protein